MKMMMIAGDGAMLSKIESDFKFLNRCKKRKMMMSKRNI